MAKPRKSWEPEYRFGGDRTCLFRPAPLGEYVTGSGATKASAKRSNGKKGKKGKKR